VPSHSHKRPDPSNLPPRRNPDHLTDRDGTTVAHPGAGRPPQRYTGPRHASRVQRSL